MGKGRYAINDRRRTTAKFGSKHSLAHIHQSGTAGGKIPARPIMLAGHPAIRQRIQEILEAHVRGRQ